MRVIVDFIDARLAGSSESNKCVLHIHDNLNIPEELYNKQYNGFIKVDPILWIDNHNNNSDYNNIKQLLGSDNKLRYGKIKISCIDKRARQNIINVFQQLHPTLLPIIYTGDLSNMIIYDQVNLD